MFITLLPCTSFAADNIQTVYMDVTYGQTEARSMLNMINEFRTGNEAWVWNESNDKQIYSELNDLNYDYDLERIAMQRAAEIALSYSHTRPDGSRCFTAYDTYYSCGENIAAGYTSAEAVFEAWKETNEKYEGQGHRRNMLNAGYTAVGISHLIYNGVHYWVQEFRNPLVNKEETEALDSTATVSIDMLLSDGNVSLSSDTKSMTISNGQSEKLPEVTTTVQMTNTWPKNSTRIVTCDYNWSVEDEQYATISGDYVTGIKAGGTTLNAVILGQKISVPIIIKEPEHTHHYLEPEFKWSKDLKECNVVFICDSCGHEETVDCTITSKETDPSCTVAGVITYTATAEFNGETYTDSKTAEGRPATGHTFKYTDNGDGTHTKECSACGETAAEEHTYEDGTCIYCQAEKPEEQPVQTGDACNIIISIAIFTISVVLTILSFNWHMRTIKK